jgi:hypothetical protein
VTNVLAYKGASGWILTHSGRRVDPLNLHPEDVDIEDIAYSLSNQCRWSGHCLWYSVAQHCYLVSLEADEQDQLWGLLHDATEAYLVDLPSPIKRQMPEYVAAEHRAMRAICTRFGLPPHEPKSVTIADEVLLATEYRDIMPHRVDFPALRAPRRLNIQRLSPDAARAAYMRRFEDLSSRTRFYKPEPESIEIEDWMTPDVGEPELGTTD